MPKVIDLTGQRFGRLVVVGQVANDKNGPCWRCRCDCSNEVIVRGEYLRQGKKKSCKCLVTEKVTESNKARTVALAERFWPKVYKNGPLPKVCSPVFGNCWLWLGSKNKAGYGKIESSGTLVQATHAAWFVTFGVWPTERVACHVCDTPACINPYHLFEGTDADNAYDRDLKARGAILIYAPSGLVK